MDKEPSWFMPRRYWILVRVYMIAIPSREIARFSLGVEALENTLIEPL